MYPLVSRISFIIRFLICWGTIERYPIFDNETIQWLVGQVLSIYTILRLICYVITWSITKKYLIKSPIRKSTIYFWIYLILTLITYLLLLLLTKCHILPY